MLLWSAVAIGPDRTPFEVYRQIGWCAGGPDTPIGTLTYPATVYECWAVCLTKHPEELVSAEFWPRADASWGGPGGKRCWCQTECHSLQITDHSADQPIELALRVGPWQAVLPDHLQPEGSEPGV